MQTATANNDMMVNKTPCSQVMVKEYNTEESASSTEVAAQRQQHRGSSTEGGQAGALAPVLGPSCLNLHQCSHHQ